jgi:hypothetical protein
MEGVVKVNKFRCYYHKECKKHPNHGVIGFFNDNYNIHPGYDKNGIQTSGGKHVWFCTTCLGDALSKICKPLEPK